MRPLSEIANAELRGIRGVIFDVDDTVTRDGRLERVAFDAMHQLHDAGFPLLAVTGRPLGWADVIARHWPVEVCVGENGAGFTYVDGHTHMGYAQSDEERARSRALLAKIRDEVARVMPHVEVADDQIARRCDLAFDVGEHASLPSQEVDELVTLIEAHGANTTVSSVHAHAVPGDWDKATGSRLVIEQVLHLEFNANEWIFIGDSGNDSAAFAAYPVSIGVANIRERAHVASFPTYITQGDRGQGFAEMAARLLAR